MTLSVNFLLLHPNKSKEIYQYNNKNITVDEVQKNVFGFAHDLLDRNIKPQDTVILKADDSIQWIYTFWALAVIGAKIMVLLNNLEQKKFETVLAKHRIHHIITDDDFANSDIPVININQIVANNTNSIVPYQYHDNESFIHWASSGTNGGFKLITHTNLSFSNSIVGVTQYYNKVNGSIDDVMFCPSKLPFGLGALFTMLGPLAVGYKSIIGISIVDELKTFDKFLQNNLVNHLILTPYVLNAVIKLNKDSLATTIKSVTTSAEPLPHTVSARFKEKFGLAVYNIYGLAELFIATFEDVAHEENSVGRVMPCVELRIVDESGIECSNGQIGIIQIKTPAQFIGYLDDQQSTDSTLRDGWVHTNDIGFFDDKEKLIFLGRANSCIKIKGTWVSLLDIENAILELPEVDECVVLQFKNSDGFDSISALIIAQNISKEYINQFLYKRFNGPHAILPSNIEFVTEISKTTNMKKIRNFNLLKEQNA